MPSTPTNDPTPRTDLRWNQVALRDVPPRRVVHAVGSLTESVVRFLRATTSLLQHAAASQYVIVLEAAGQREFIEPQLPSGVSLSVMDDNAGFWRRRKAWAAAYRDVQAGGVLDVLHLHGNAPWSLVAGMGIANAPRRLLYSPHRDWDTRMGWQLRLLDGLTGSMRRPKADPTGPGSRLFGTPFPGRQREPVTLIHSPLAPEWLTTRRLPGAYPLVVASAGGRWLRAAQGLAQLAVLAEHGAVGAPVFEWSGESDASAALTLNAAGIRIYRDEEPTVRAERLSRAWVFVSAGPDVGFPLHIAEAMACGVPVVALDTPRNRQLVVNGVNGFLCRSVEAMFAPVRTLIKDSDLRRSLGESGRLRVLEQYGPEAFARRVLDAYGFDPLERPLGNALDTLDRRRVG